MVPFSGVGILCLDVTANCFLVVLKDRHRGDIVKHASNFVINVSSRSLNLLLPWSERRL